MQKLKVGVIGLGKMGLLHAGIFNSLDKSKLCAISDKDKILLGALKNYLPGTDSYLNYMDLLEMQDLDIVVVTSPVSLHKEMINASLKRGAAVFVEKPLALNGAECRAILSSNHKNITMVGYCRRFMETYNLAKRILDDGTLGKANYFDSHIYVSQTFRAGSGWLYRPELSGGGVLMDLGSHAIDLLHYFFGDIKTVSAFARSVFNENVEDYVSANLQFEESIFGSLQASWSVRGYRLPEFKISIQLDEGSIIVTEKYITIFSQRKKPRLKEGWSTFYKQDLAESVPFNVAGHEYTLEDLHFLKCVENDRGTNCDFREASRTSFVIDKIYSSIQNDRSESIAYGG